jgi:Tfp pilus assembly protein PilO
VSMRMRFVALIALSLVVTIVWYTAAFKPSRAKLSEVRADVTRTQAEVAALTTKLQHLQDLKRNEKELRAEFAKLENALPVEPAVSDFILDVQEAADQAGISFLSIAPSLPTAMAGASAPTPAASSSPAPTAGEEAEAATSAPTTTAPSVQNIAVSLTANGKFFTIEDFVAKLEKLERALRVTQFSLSGSGGDTAASGAAAPAAGGTGNPNVSLSISLQIFMGGAPAPAATTTAPTTGSGT